MMKILWHSGEISSRLQAFFQEQDAELVKPENFVTGTELTHVLLSGDQDFHLIRKMFDTVTNDVSLVALSEVKELASFVANNGRFVIDQNWLVTPMGQVHLEKFFLGRASVHLDENFPSVKEGASFKITNHLRVGLDLDRLSAFVHARDGAVVNVRTFVDHVLYYLVYLKQAGVGGLPIEVDYGHTGQDMVVQIHLSVRNYVAEYLLDSFGQPSGQDPLRYLLSVCAHSADFMEIQYIQNASKLVISGLWQDRRGERTLGFGGILLNQVLSSQQIERQIDQEMKRLAVEKPEKEAELAQELNDKLLPDQMQPLVEEELFHTIKEDAPEEEFVQVITGGEQEEEHSQVVKGSADEAELVQKISGGSGDEKVKQIIKGEKANLDESVTRIGPGEPDGKAGAWTVKAGESGGKNAKADSWTVKAGEGGGMNAKADAWTVKAGEGAGKNAKADGLKMKSSEGGIGNGSGAGAPEGIDAKQSALMARLRTLESENVKTKSQLETAQSEIRILKESRDQMAMLDRRAKETASLAPTVTAEDVMSLEQRMQLMQTLANGQTDAAAGEKIRKALEREQKMILAARQAETEVRKAKLEMMQKEAYFIQEIEKANRAVKTRDVVVQKAKDGLAIIVSKKDREIDELKMKMTALLASQGVAQQAGGAQKIKDLEQEKQSLSRLVEVYKNKIAFMATSIEKQASATNPKKDEDVRKITMEKQRAEVALQTLQKEHAKQKSKSDLDQSELQRLRSEKAKIEESLRQAVSNAGPTSSTAIARAEAQTVKIRELQQEVTQQTLKLGRADAQTKELEQKVLELTTSLAKAPSSQPDSTMKSKLAQMEASVKKLSMDFAAATNQLGEAKKEMNKLRSENTALKNLADKAKKDAEKASKGKPGAADKKAS
jgi:hypothetical protein